MCEYLILILFWRQKCPLNVRQNRTLGMSLKLKMIKMSHNLSKNNVSARTRSLKHCYLKKFASYNFFFSFYYFALHMEPLRGHGDGKKKNEMKGEVSFNAFAFSRKIIAFPQRLCILSQNISVPLRNLQKHVPLGAL